MAIVQFRIEDNLKQQATELFNDLGIDLSTALRSFIKRSILVGGFPYPMIVNNNVQGIAITNEKEDEVKSLLKRLSEIEDEEFQNALAKCEDISDDDEYGKIVLAKINKEIRLAREERKRKL